MYIKQVSFQNFRNFSNLKLTLDPGFIVLAGPNGAGKTNFLEGLCFGLSLGRFPPSELDQLFWEGENFFRLALNIFSGEETTFEVFCERQEERLRQQLKINSQVVGRSQFMRCFPVISFLPEDLNLLGHSPANRRRFLDETLTASSAEYRQALSQYNKALKQRNLALEQKTELEVWDEELANYGSQITAERKKFITFINDYFFAVLKKLSPELKDTAAQYHYAGEVDKNGFLARLAQARSKDEQLLTTSVGPHRDDFELFDNNHTIVGYVSRGQLRSLTLALKILERMYLEETLKTAPLILLDDVFSEFDAPHQQHLLEFLKTFEQVFLTTTHLEEVKDHLPANSQVYNVNNGVIGSLSDIGEG